MIVQALLVMCPLAAEVATTVEVRPSSDLAEGIRQYQALEYRRAKISLRRALGDASLATDDKAQACAYLARVFAVLDRPKPAQRLFATALRLQPGFQVSWEESPRIREAFAAAQAQVAEETRNAPPGAAAGGPALVAAVDIPPLEPDEEEPAETLPATRRWLIIGLGAAAAVGVATTVVLLVSGNDRLSSSQRVGTWHLP